ncbi:hypothetical protein [Gordonia soli]|uniref:Alkaline shock response membrane anchor protein AmaP n=1 Tax=Gordonia soli NBRC 108243 TaxID=1223545 RepID=M0QD27_9ACTN|nr:hypothetical protein [Gordonia soli]GAC66460.1 hypothetical protein GS4_02_01710 [Gordonia soli NBRC 108243]
MNRLPAALHRISVGLIGLLLLVVGIGAILWRAGVEPVVGWIDRFDADAPRRIVETDWWAAVLVGVVLIATLWGWRLIVSRIRPGRVADLVLDGSDGDGAMTIAPKLIAAAVADDLRKNTIFDRVAATATDDRGRKIIRLTVTAPPTHSYPEIAAMVGDAVEDIRTAVDGSDVHVQALVHLEKRRG